MSFSQIKKRNGAMAEFEATRIEIAIEKASQAAGGEVPSEDVSLLVESVTSNLETMFVEGTPDVETIQDLVEQELMRSGHYQTARTYIVYRDTRQAVREAAERDSSQKLEHRELRIVGKDGKEELFSYARLVKDLLVAADGLDKDVDVDELAQAARRPC